MVRFLSQKVGTFSVPRSWYVFRPKKLVRFPSQEVGTFSVPRSWYVFRPRKLVRFPSQKVGTFSVPKSRYVFRPQKLVRFPSQEVGTLSVSAEPILRQSTFTFDRARSQTDFAAIYLYIQPNTGWNCFLTHKCRTTRIGSCTAPSTHPPHSLSLPRHTYIHTHTHARNSYNRYCVCV